MKIAVLYACFTLYDYTAGFAALYEVVYLTCLCRLCILTSTIVLFCFRWPARQTTLGVCGSMIFLQTSGCPSCWPTNQGQGTEGLRSFYIIWCTSNYCHIRWEGMDPFKTHNNIWKWPSDHHLQLINPSSVLANHARKELRASYHTEHWVSWQLFPRQKEHKIYVARERKTHDTVNN